MKIRHKALTEDQRNQLRSVGSGKIRLLAAAGFVVVSSFVGYLAHLFCSVIQDFFDLGDGPWWILLTLAGMFGVYRLGAKFTGGASFRRQCQEDLREGLAVITTYEVTEAIRVEEALDEGASYVLKTADGRSLYCDAGTMQSYSSTEFPFESFEVIEGKHSKMFFGIEPLGQPIQASLTRAPFSADEESELRVTNAIHQLLDVDFEDFKRNAAKQSADP